jgi:hypothetical protein
LHEALKLFDPLLRESGFDLAESSVGACREWDPRRRTRDRDGQDESHDLVGVELRGDHHRRCLEVDATAWARHAADVEAAVTQKVDIAQDRPTGHGELVGEVSDRPVASATKERQQGVPPGEGAHAPRLQPIGDKFWHH